MGNEKITSEGKFNTQWGTVETFEKIDTCKDYCPDCNYEGNGFTEVSGNNGWDNYSYTICPKCGK